MIKYHSFFFLKKKDYRNGVVINAKRRCRVIGGRRHIRWIMKDAGNMTGKHRAGASYYCSTYYSARKHTFI
jgi:hypothetical protein